jgi:tetratricopeptide (TPR) repeat protein
MDFSRYIDVSAVPVLNIDHHLDIKFEWKMSGKMQVYVNEGRNFLNEGKFDLAISNLNEALKLDSTFWPAHYYRGVALTKKNQYQDAIKAFERVVRLNPDQAQAHIELGRVYQRMGNSLQAGVCYDDAMMADRGLAEGYFGMATVKLQLGFADQASRLLQDCIGINPSFGEAYVLLSLLKYDGKTNVEESIALLNAAMKNNPKYTASYFWRGFFHVQQNLPEKGLADWSFFISSNPTNSFVLTMRGFLLIELDRFDEAFTDLKKVFLSRAVSEEAFKGTQTLLDKQIDLQAATQYVLRTGYGLNEAAFSSIKKAYCLLLIGKSNKGLAELQRTESIEKSATVLLLMGIAFEHLDDHASAFRSYDAALKLDNDIFDAHKKRGIYRIELRDWRGVDEDVREMMRLMPESKIPYRIRGFARSHQDDCKGAMSDLNRYMETDSLDVEALKTRAICMFKIGDQKAANNDLRKVLKYKTDDWQLHEIVAANYIKYKDTTNALEVLELYASRRSDSYRVHLSLARIYVKKKQWQEAQKSLDALIPLVKRYSAVYAGPSLQDYSEALWLQGDVYFARGQYAMATANCTAALDLNKANLAAKYTRARSYEMLGDRTNATADFKDLSKSGYGDAEVRYKKLSQE